MTQIPVAQVADLQVEIVLVLVDHRLVGVLLLEVVLGRIHLV